MYTHTHLHIYIYIYKVLREAHRSPGCAILFLLLVLFFFWGGPLLAHPRAPPRAWPAPNEELPLPLPSAGRAEALLAEGVGLEPLGGGKGRVEEEGRKGGRVGGKENVDPG